MCTLHLTPRALYFTLHTLNFILDTLHTTFYTFTLYTTLYTPHSTLDTPAPSTPHTHYPVRFTLHNFPLTHTCHPVHCTLHTLHCKLYIFTLYTLLFTLGPHNFALLTLYAAWNLGLASFSCCARTPASRPQLSFFTALLLPALPKVHSDTEGGPLNLPQSLVIMLAMLNFFILFVQEYTIICSHPHLLQRRLPQDVGLGVHLTNMSRFQTHWSTLTKKLRSCAVPFVFSCQVPCQTSVRLTPGPQVNVLQYKFQQTPL